MSDNFFPDKGIKWVVAYFNDGDKDSDDIYLRIDTVPDFWVKKIKDDSEKIYVKWPPYKTDSRMEKASRNRDKPEDIPGIWCLA